MEHEEEEPYPTDPERIANVRRWLKQECDKHALSNPNLAFLHSDNSLDKELEQYEPFWEYDSDLSDLDELGPF